MNENFKESLKSMIIENSDSSSFEEAALEWQLHKFKKVKCEGIDCICNKRNIKNLFFVINKITKIQLIIGSDCIERFLTHIKTRYIENGVNSLLNNKIPNPNFLSYLYNNNLINIHTLNFLNTNYGKKNKQFPDFIDFQIKEIIYKLEREGILEK